MKKKLTLIIIIYFFAINLYSNNTFITGTETNFLDYNLENLEIAPGNKGINYINIQDNEYTPNHETDLLLHFNSSQFIDSAGNYIVKKHYNNTTDIEKVLGPHSVYFLNGQEIIFSAEDNSMFTKGRILGDFSIEFWINPTIIGSDTSIFTWKGVNKVDKEFIAQKLTCFFENRKLTWSFKNFFIPEDQSQIEIKLTGKSRLVPNKWTHHLIRYNSKTGLIEYLMNGIPEDIKYSTRLKEESNEILTPYIGNFSKSEIYIGSRYRGFIDELRISESFIDSPNLSKYRDKGIFKTDIFDLNKEEVLIESIIVDDIVPDETYIDYYYRTSSTPIDVNNKENWLSLSNFSDSQIARYIQIKGILHSNGNKNITPSLSNIEINWRSIPKPPPPQYIDLTTNKNQITLRWETLNHLNIKGYKIYYGPKSNYYEEVIDIGNNYTYTISNLESNKIYYFSIRAYNARNSEGEYSREIYARPK